MLYLKNVSNKNNFLLYSERLSQKESVLQINCNIRDGDKIEVMRPLSYFALLYQIESVENRIVKLIGHTEPSNYWSLSNNCTPKVEDISLVRAGTMRDAVMRYCDSGVVYVTHELLGEFTIWQKFSLSNGVITHLELPTNRRQFSSWQS